MIPTILKKEEVKKLNLVVDPSQLRTLSSNVASYADAFNDFLTKVKNDNQALEDVWVGEDIMAYTNTITEQQQAMDALYTALTEMVATMNSIAAAYEDAQNSLAAAAGGGGN